ncbi:MAG: hypothetical protein CSA62_10240 [Planctomycetota bacterium]|nr:MAG: hypothetical protein CSA62_10240 [Planctomycetota bacterium]
MLPSPPLSRLDKHRLPERVFALVAGLVLSCALSQTPLAAQAARPAEPSPDSKSRDSKISDKAPRRFLEMRQLLGADLLQMAEGMSRKACAGLAALQGRDGSFALRPAKNPAPVAVTALSTMALLSFGHLPGRGKYGPVVERATRYLLMQQRGPGEKAEGYIGAESDKYSKMHGHGYATTCLAQLYGMLPRGAEALVDGRRLRRALESSVSVICSSQEKQTGGWSYEPVPVAHEGSITICVVQALRACKDAGIQVNSKVISRAVRYVELSQKPDGSIRYQLGSSNSSVALTAAAAATLQASGQYESPVLAKALAFLIDSSPIYSDPGGVRSAHKRFPYYERLYVGEALFSARDLSHFHKWYPRLVKGLAQTQDPNTGLWTSREYSSAYASAMNLLVLSLPFQLLPIHQR